MKTAVKRRIIKPHSKFQNGLDTFGRFCLICLIAPFYYGWKGSKALSRFLFYETIKTGNNGIFGPGYRSYTTTRFSWGRLSFILLIIFILFLFFLFLTNYLIINL